MRTLTLGLLLVTLAFAGCLSGDDDPEPTTSSSTTSTSHSSTTTTSSGTTTTSSSTSTSTAPTPNQAPTGSISAAINGTLVDFNLTGSDADNDTLTWTLSFGDGNQTNGSVLPAAVNHTFAAGNYTANFTITDGEAEVVLSTNLTILASDSGPIQQASVTWNAAASGCAAEYPAVPPAAQAGNAAYGLVGVDPATIGHTFTAVITWTAGPLPLGADVSFYDETGSYIDGILVDGAPPVTIEGAVPAGAAFAVFSLCDAVNSASASYVVA